MSENFICPLPSLQNSKTSLPVNIQTSPPSLIPLIPLHRNLIPPYFPTLFLSTQTIFMYTRERIVYFIFNSQFLKKNKFKNQNPLPDYYSCCCTCFFLRVIFIGRMPFLSQWGWSYIFSLHCKLFFWWLRFSTILSGWVWKRWHKME